MLPEGEGVAGAAAELHPDALVLGVGVDGFDAATGTVDALLPLWFAIVKLNGGNRKVALGIIR